MKDDEFSDEFYANLNDIVNSIFNLGEWIPKIKIVRNVLRFLLKRFRPKVTTIEESKDSDDVKIEVLVRSLQIYELSLPQCKRKISVLALNTIKEETSDKIANDTPKDEDVAYLAKKFFRINKRPSEKLKGDSSKYRTIKERRKILGILRRGLNLLITMSFMGLDIPVLNAQVIRKS